MTNGFAIALLKQDIQNSKRNISYWHNEVGIEALELAIKALEQTRWIPVSERLPEKNGKYLVTVKNGNVYAGVYDAFSGRFQCAATAWMPLSESYRGESK